MTARLTLLCLTATPLLIALGHVGVDDLDWRLHVMSLYAARAAGFGLVSAGMTTGMLSAAGLGRMAWQASARDRALRAAAVSMASAAVGAALVGAFEMSPDPLTQALHDIGRRALQLGAALGLAFAGLSAWRSGRKWGRQLGVLLAAIPWLSFAAIVAPWAPAGVRQRASFFTLWTGSILLYLLIKRRTRRHKM